MTKRKSRGPKNIQIICSKFTTLIMLSLLSLRVLLEEGEEEGKFLGSCSYRVVLIKRKRVFTNNSAKSFNMIKAGTLCEEDEKKENLEEFNKNIKEMKYLSKSSKIPRLKEVNLQ